MTRRARYLFVSLFIVILISYLQSVSPNGPRCPLDVAHLGRFDYGRLLNVCSVTVKPTKKYWG